MSTDKSTKNSGPLKHGGCVGYRWSPEYQCWQHIKGRCYNKNNQDYYLYGAKGITVCDRWIASFENFLEDMGKRPSDIHSIDRKDGSLGYSPENCRWATPLEQGQNTNRVHLITFNGETHCIREWARKTGVKHSTILMRVRRGWSPEKALTEPIRQHPNRS